MASTYDPGYDPHARERTMSIGNVFTLAINAFRNAPLLLFGSAFVLGGLPQGLSTYIQVAAPQLQLAEQFRVGTVSPGVVIVSVLVFVIVFVALALVMQAMTTRAALVAMSGGEATLSDCLGIAFRRMFPMLGLVIVSGLAIGLASLLLLVPGIILAVVWYVAVPVLVLEPVGVFESLGRSADLTRGSRWIVFAVIVLQVVAYLGIAAIVGGITYAAGAASGGGTSGAVIGAALSAISSTLTTVLSVVVPTAAYAELRDRLEGPASHALDDVFA